MHLQLLGNFHFHNKIRKEYNRGKAQVEWFGRRLREGWDGLETKDVEYEAGGKDVGPQRRFVDAVKEDVQRFGVTQKVARDKVECICVSVQ